MKQLRDELWLPTPCTIPFVSASNSFNKTERFKLFSIYHKDDVNKPKPVFNDIEKPQLLLQQFRREIQEASSDRFKRLNLINRRNSQRLPTPRSKSKSKRSNSPDKLITDKLYKLKEKQDGRYDRYGNRCNLNAQPEDQTSKNPSEYSSQVSKSQNKVSFWTSSHRIDLSRPLNFYPAPNSYRHIDFLSQRKWIPVPGRRDPKPPIFQIIRRWRQDEILYSLYKWVDVLVRGETKYWSTSICLNKSTLRLRNCRYNRLSADTVYATVKDKIGKKGLLKKLVEHLSSHRNFLSDCAQTNYRIMKDRNSFIGRVTGLLVANTLVQNLTEFQAIQLHPRAVNVKMSKLSTPKVYNQTFGEGFKANAGVQFKFQNVYFQQVMQIYEQQQFLRHQVLQGLSTFSMKKEGNFSCDRLVMFVLDRLLREIKSNNNVAECCKTFGQILSKSNENMELTEGSSQALRIIMTVWINNQDPMIQQSCQHIIKVYINRCLTSRDYGFVYSVIFYIYDNNQFQPELMEGIQAKIIEIVSQDELKHQFMKGLFKYLLTYLSVTNNPDIMSARWELGVYEVHYETLKSRYPKILKRTNKINGFNTLHRWINNNYLSFNQLILFSRNSLAGCFIFNIFSYCQTDKALADIASANFLQVCTRCDTTCICLLFQIIIDQIFKINRKTMEPGSVLVDLACKCIRSFRLMDHISPQEIPSIMRPIEVSLPHRTRLQILYLYSVVLQGCTAPISNQLIQAFCRVINSLFDNLAVTNETLMQKYLMITSTYTIIKKFYDIGQIELVLALRKKLEVRQINQGINYTQRYFQKFLMFSLIQLVEKAYCLPNEMRQINRLIMIQEEKKANSDIYMFMHSQSSTTASSRIKQGSSKLIFSSKRLQYLQRQFERFSDQQIVEQPNQMTIVIHDRNKNSVVSETVKGDESLQQIFGLIRDGGKSVSQKQQNGIVQRSRTRL